MMRRGQTPEVPVRWLLVIAILSLAAPLSAQPASATQAAIDGAENVPVLAYYYIWYSEDSWDRAKLDLPLLGAYSSDDPDVMRAHIRWAREAGIDGFIVCWKDSETLTRRLIQLVEIAREESFPLAINYESLDYSRNPLPVEKVSIDLTLFADMFSDDAVFKLFGRPVVIWSGTWKYDRDEIERVTGPLRDRLQILASQRQTDAYLEIADLVDGNAYYWSSVNPETFPDYPGKLLRMSDAVHANGGRWFAPAAPGFDARHLGGEQAVERQGGEMLETQLETALGSDPDAVGLISWNEFSENSHVEPSCVYGSQTLEATAALIGGSLPDITARCDESALATAQAGAYADFPGTPASAAGFGGSLLFEWDSSAPEGRAGVSSGVQGTILLAPISALMVVSVLIVVRRSLRQAPCGIPTPSANVPPSPQATVPIEKDEPS